ncbi:CapA family protein [Caldilinea sp.]|uniref:CapA family protein n=1 Tax=Caldilinea sp. TaxID=2293560 RepID=UPI0026161479|nr:CapA family protein [uncultured Caldilinea sp.]
MMPDRNLHKVVLFIALGLITFGGVLIFQGLSPWRAQSSTARPPETPVLTAVASRPPGGVANASTPNAERTPTEAQTTPTTAPQTPPISIWLDADAAPALRDAVESLSVDGVHFATAPEDAALRLSAEPGPNAQRAYTLTFAAATRFDTIHPLIAWREVQALWRGEPLEIADASSLSLAPQLTRIVVLTETLPLLTQALGAPGPKVVGISDAAALVDAAWQDRATLVILPFEQLEPRLVVLAIDGQNPVENSAHFDPAQYPLVAHLYAQAYPSNEKEAERIAEVLNALPPGNRDPDRLTVLTMTGVTAMCRLTAAQMERFGPAWPAEVVGPELASADITHISNEVPFVEGCEPNTDPNNFNFCSKPEYVETLFASGVDIVGMTGNHQNDFGRQNAIASLEMYEAWGLPYYGGGRNLAEALKPLYIEHNGNRLAFLGANSYGPPMAWATDALPGAAPFDLNILSATIRSIKEKNLADIVLVELQYQESYDVQPLVDQRLDFNALVRAGADIVTGVQSHVPQAMEFTDSKLVLYGLGNLYFDQMWSQATREGMVVKHTFYHGRHLSTQILTTMLYDYGQPHWTTSQERANILRRVFGASYW